MLNSLAGKPVLGMTCRHELNLILLTGTVVLPLRLTRTPACAKVTAARRALHRSADDASRFSQTVWVTPGWPAWKSGIGHRAAVRSGDVWFQRDDRVVGDEDHWAAVIIIVLRRAGRNVGSR